MLLLVYDLLIFPNHSPPPSKDTGKPVFVPENTSRHGILKRPISSASDAAVQAA
ncbi:hypothetical protein HMPREF9123_1021 [Neisseria bacilliformis ATCC BAA-1200]|uniref:Uncharacterized protein n=1 Tax=Neisseria bacilliformis ATCC BAA-1200 TaxID=888742 RepID=F2BBB6_9NEIS|nr:hypothetical protein HMPREF9123_1021 [Neisseria bacilliformis ATCC BAA-1200]